MQDRREKAEAGQGKRGRREGQAERRNPLQPPSGRRRAAAPVRRKEDEAPAGDWAPEAERSWTDESIEEAPAPRGEGGWGEEESGRGRGLSSLYDEDQVTGRRATRSFGSETPAWEEEEDSTPAPPGSRKRGAALEEEEIDDESDPVEAEKEERRKAPSPRRRAPAAAAKPKRSGRPTSAPRSGRGPARDD